MPESPNSFSSKFARQRHWPLGIFVALIGVVIKKCGKKIVLHFCVPAESTGTDFASAGTPISGNADSLAGTLSLATSISGTLFCLLGLFIIARGVVKSHALDDEK